MTTKRISRENIGSRIAVANNLLKKHNLSCDIFDSYLTEDMIKGNIENFIGAIAIPLGLCGPINIHGQYAEGEFIVPMATEEGTVVATYSRGAKIINESGGCETLVYDDYFLRAVQFRTASLKKSAELIKWCKSHESEISILINKSGNFVRLLEMSYDCLGTTVIVTIKLHTSDAMGSNMSSEASHVLSDYVSENSGLVESVVLPYPEDKKFIPSRQKGKKVIARVVLRREPYTRITRTSLEALEEFTKNYKDLLASHGCYSLNIHAANGMAAMFQALGQDMAYLGECSQVIVSSHFVDADHLEFSVTLPTLIIGTVGAATGLHACKTALSIMDCYGAGKAKKLAEIIASVVLAGEISCASAQCAFEFVQAHETMGKNYPMHKE